MKLRLIIFCAIAIIALSSCTPESKYDYVWEIEVVYLNGDTETMHLEKTYRGNAELDLNGNAGQCISIYATSMLGREDIACGVRKFTVLSEVKTKHKETEE